MAAAMRRRVLQRDDFGLCVCWPKTHWAKVPAPGESTTLLVNDEARTVTVHSEPCNCQGTGWHEHRFLGLPADAGFKPGTWVMVAPAGATERG